MKDWIFQAGSAKPEFIEGNRVVRMCHHAGIMKKGICCARLVSTSLYLDTIDPAADPPRIINLFHVDEFRYLYN